MSKTKIIQMTGAGIFSLLVFFVIGCGNLTVFNPNFLNTFQPFGQTSLNTVQGSGPLTVIFANFTIEAKHQENALITVRYISSEGNLQTFTTQALNAVPEANRDPNGLDFDPSFKQTIVLDCGIQQMFFTGTVYRTHIESKSETVDLGNQRSQEVTFCTASVDNNTVDASGLQVLTTTTFDAFPGVQLPAVPLLETQHFKCGDVILVGILDQRARNGAVVAQTYNCNYVDLASLPATSIPADTDLLFPAINPKFVFDPTNALLTGEYQYPASYVIIPLVLPNIQSANSALPALQALAVQYAEQ